MKHRTIYIVYLWGVLIGVYDSLKLARKARTESARKEFDPIWAEEDGCTFEEHRRQCTSIQKLYLNKNRI